MRWDSTIAGESHTKNALLRLRLFLLARFPVPTLSSGSRQLQSRNLLEKFNYLVPTGNQDSRQLPLFARLAQKTLLNEAKIIIMRYRRKLLRNNRNTAGRNRY